MIRTTLLAGITALVAGIGPALAGPCTDRIRLMEKAVTTGEAGGMPRPIPVQAAPGGAAPRDTTKELMKALEETREADQRGDAEACNKALDEAQRYVKS